MHTFKGVESQFVDLAAAACRTASIIAAVAPTKLGTEGMTRLATASAADSAARSRPTRPMRIRVGLDLVEVSRVRASMQHFGQRFLRRLFSDDEVRYAMSGNDACAERLAARFAAKEAAIKAFALAEVGVSWRDIEVCKQGDGSCQLVLRGRAAAQAAQMGVSSIALSLSHDGGYAGAVVTALCDGAAGDPGALIRSSE